MTVLLVGEANPHSADPRHALLPVPRGAAGDRLRRLFEMTLEEYLTAFTRVNLCATAWDRAAARARAQELDRLWSGNVVMLGRRVASAFEYAYLPFQRFGAHLVLPHPSGRCRAWNDPLARMRARDAVRDMIGRNLRGGTDA